jgi:outer membrane protein, heavy metal efflux system
LFSNPSAASPHALQDDRTTTLNALNAYAQTWMAIHQLSFATATEVTP